MYVVFSHWKVSIRDDTDLYHSLIRHSLRCSLDIQRAARTWGSTMETGAYSSRRTRRSTIEQLWIEAIQMLINLLF